MSKKTKVIKIELNPNPKKANGKNKIIIKENSSKKSKSAKKAKVAKTSAKLAGKKINKKEIANKKAEQKGKALQKEVEKKVAMMKAAAKKAVDKKSAEMKAAAKKQAEQMKEAEKQAAKKKVEEKKAVEKKVAEMKATADEVVAKKVAEIKATAEKVVAEKVAEMKAAAKIVAESKNTKKEIKKAAKGEKLVESVKQTVNVVAGNMTNNIVTKAVIPAAGFGTRLLPATKAVPKELLPIVNVPTLEYIIQEAIDTGIKEVLVIISEDKEAIKKHFATATRLEKFLIEKNKLNCLKLIQKFKDDVKISFVVQDQQLGLGHAIGFAKRFVKNQPFAVLLGDDVIVSKEKTALQQCIDAYYKTSSSIVGVQPVLIEDVKKYGIVDPLDKKEGYNSLFSVKNLIEKPEPSVAPTNLAIMGRYVLTPSIFDAIKNTPKDPSGEIQITNALKLLLITEKVYACRFDGKRYDVGNKLGLVKATIDFALRDDEIKDDILKFIRKK